MYMSSLVVALAAAARLFMVHIGLHKENDCHMTYMWRHISLVELSFLSGATVNRERDFVMKAISTVQAMYSRKIVLIGHSFGGTIIHALPACPDFDISKLGLVIALAAPLVAPQPRGSPSVVVYSRSGYRCRSFVYPVVQPVNKEFFQSERIATHLKISEKCADEERTFGSASHCASNITQIGIFDYPWVSRSYRGALEESRKIFKLDFPSPYTVYSVSLESKCEASLLFVYSNSLARFAAVRGDSRVMIVDLPYGLNSTTGYIVMEGKEGCDYDVNIRPDMFHSWYLALTSNAQLLLHFLFSVCMALAVFEKLAGSGQGGQYFQGGFYLNGCIVVVV
ncbi:unnamed protein product [Heligmosomoides polygyrus]|uniref:Post-GPI attachment to proteins factor 1 n=1 Tax=Heligmosomoides polygyrus TaxID=6339 RepID=A0A3P8CEK1_HELPZ|nr:unnamed protein product [Heligmosomoides polygyrus]